MRVTQEHQNAKLVTLKGSPKEDCMLILTLQAEINRDKEPNDEESSS